MKKIISIALSVIVVFLCCFCFYAYIFNYKYNPDYTELQDVISGYSKETISIGQYEKDYYELLDNSLYKCLNFVESSGIAFTTTDVPSIYFSSIKLIDSEKYSGWFVYCNMFVKNDNVYLFVTYKEDDGRFSRSIYQIENNNLAQEIESDDAKSFSLLDELMYALHDDSVLFAKKYGIIIVIIFVITGAAIYLILKQKRQSVKPHYSKK